MRTVSGGLLVAVGLLIFYLIVSGRLAAGIAAYHAAVDAMGTGTKPASNPGPVPSGHGGTLATAVPLTLPPMPTMPTLTTPIAAMYA